MLQIPVNLFENLNMTQINQFWKRKNLILVDLLKKTDCNTKITKIEDKIPSISGLATSAGLTVVKNNMPNVNNLVKKRIMTQNY